MQSIEHKQSLLERFNTGVVNYFKACYSETHQEALLDAFAMEDKEAAVAEYKRVVVGGWSAFGRGMFTFGLAPSYRSGEEEFKRLWRFKHNLGEAPSRTIDSVFYRFAKEKWGSSSTRYVLSPLLLLYFKQLFRGDRFANITLNLLTEATEATEDQQSKLVSAWQTAYSKYSQGKLLRCDLERELTSTEPQHSESIMEGFLRTKVALDKTYPAEAKPTIIAYYVDELKEILGEFERENEALVRAHLETYDAKCFLNEVDKTRDRIVGHHTPPTAEM